MESSNEMDSAQPSMGELQSSSPAPTAPLAAPPAAPAVPLAPIISNNAEGFKYKYPEAKPTPPGVDDAEWNRTYTAADSRKYNYAGKNHKESRKFRQSGETRELALKMLAEKQAKAAEQAKGGGTPSKKASKPSAPKQKIETTPSAITRDATPAGPSLSISEQIKSEGRARKAVSVAPSSSSNQGTPAPTPTATGPKMSPAKTKKGTATTIKKPSKKPKNQGRMGTPSSSKGDNQTPGPKAAAGEDGEEDGDSDSNDGGEYCVCRGPDDHRMMVYCEGGCDDWYHCSCMGMDVEDARELLDTFICPQCKTEEKFTLWKRMCRCYTIEHMRCRKAARVAATPPSMYCSDEHKDNFWKHVATIARQDNEPSKGGVLNKFEIADLVHQVKTKAGMDALGQKPRLPKPEGADPSRPAGLDHLTQEEEQTIAKFKAKQEKNKAQIDGLRGQLMLLKLVNDRNKIANQHPDAKGKAYCGYDSRLSFNGPQFAKWKESTEGKMALENKVLGPRTNETKSIDTIILMDGEVAPPEPVVADVLKSMCLNPKKKCPQHRDWYKVHEEDFHFSSKNLKDENARLQRKIDEIVDDAETREATKEDEAHNVTIQLF